jgi:hypothetical protein
MPFRIEVAGASDPLSSTTKQKASSDLGTGLFDFVQQRLPEDIAEGRCGLMTRICAGWLRAATSDRGSPHGRAPGALPVEDLLPDDVGVPAVLGEFTQHVEVHPAKREWPEPVAVDLVV